MHRFGVILQFFFLLWIGSQAFASTRPEDMKDEKGQKLYSAYRQIIPTIYYIPFINLDRAYQCQAKDTKITVFSIDKRPIADLCRADYRNCMMQGSCIIVKNKKRTMVNYRKFENGRGLFALMETTECPYGRGPRSVCVEPFYTVAADLKHYQLGDILYAPELKGTKLPNGEIHNGYLIVRDTGGRIVGYDRFDFFTGFYHYQDSYNPFTEKGLQDKRKRLHYLKILSPDLKAKIQKMRGYPKLGSEF